MIDTENNIEVQEYGEDEKADIKTFSVNRAWKMMDADSGHDSPGSDRMIDSSLSIHKEYSCETVLS